MCTHFVRERRKTTMHSRKRSSFIVRRSTWHLDETTNICLSCGLFPLLFAFRFRHLHDTAYMDTAIAFSKIYVSLTIPHTHSEAVEKNHLAGFLSQRYWNSPTDDGVHQLQIAMDHFRDAANTSQNPLYIRFHASLFRIAIAVQHSFGEEMALGGVPQVFRASSTTGVLRCGHACVLACHSAIHGFTGGRCYLRSDPWAHERSS